MIIIEHAPNCASNRVFNWTSSLQSFGACYVTEVLRPPYHTNGSLLSSLSIPLCKCILYVGRTVVDSYYLLLLILRYLFPLLIELSTIDIR